MDLSMFVNHTLDWPCFLGFGLIIFWNYSAGVLLDLICSHSILRTMCFDLKSELFFITRLVQKLTNGSVFFTPRHGKQEQYMANQFYVSLHYIKTHSMRIHTGRKKMQEQHHNIFISNANRSDAVKGKQKINIWKPHRNKYFKPPLTSKILWPGLEF